MIRDKKKKRSPALITTDVVALTHLALVNIIYFVGQYTSAFNFLKSESPGRDIVYNYIDYPVFIALEAFFQLCATMFSSLPLIGFIGPWFEWFFIESDDHVFLIMHAEFVMVAASIFYGICTYVGVVIFLKVFGLDED